MKRTNFIVLLMIATFMIAGVATVSAQGEWKKLGDENVNFNVDHDTINVKDSSRIRELRVSVKNAPVKFLRMVINYTDGTKQDLEWLEDVALGRDSRTIMIEGDGHVIDSVEFWYETASLGGKKAHVTLYGRSYNGASPVSVAPVSIAAPVAVSVPVMVERVALIQGEWKDLGDEDVQFDLDHDTIEISDSGRFRELRLLVENAPIKFSRVLITYMDGVKQDVEYLENVEVGRHSRSIAIQGDGHVIKTVEFWYETASLGGKKAHVTLYGR